MMNCKTLPVHYFERDSSQSKLRTVFPLSFIDVLWRKWKLKGKVRNARDSTGTSLYFYRVFVVISFLLSFSRFRMLCYHLYSPASPDLFASDIRRSTAPIQSGPSICSNHNSHRAQSDFSSIFAIEYFVPGCCCTPSKHLHRVYFESVFPIQTYSSKIVHL